MAITKFYTPITAAALEAILQYIPKLQGVRPDEVYIHSPGEVLELEPLTIRMHGEYHPIVEQFLYALYRNGFVQDYDWGKFIGRAVEIYDHPEKLRRVSLRTCVKLLTLHARRERFFDGHFAAMMVEGQLAAILDRIATISAEMKNVQSSGYFGEFNS